MLSFLLCSIPIQGMQAPSQWHPSIMPILQVQLAPVWLVLMLTAAQPAPLSAQLNSSPLWPILRTCPAYLTFHPFRCGYLKSMFVFCGGKKSLISEFMLVTSATNHSLFKTNILVWINITCDAKVTWLSNTFPHYVTSWKTQVPAALQIFCRATSQPPHNNRWSLLTSTPHLGCLHSLDLQVNTHFWEAYAHPHLFK